MKIKKPTQILREAEQRRVLIEGTPLGAPEGTLFSTCPGEHHLSEMEPEENKSYDLPSKLFLLTNSQGTQLGLLGSEMDSLRDGWTTFRCGIIGAAGPYDEGAQDEPWQNEVARELNLLLAIAADDTGKAAIASIVSRVANFENIALSAIKPDRKVKSKIKNAL